MSDKDQIFQELQSYIVEQLGVEKEKVKPEAAFIEDLNADSLDLVEFAMGLEEKFGVTIADEELGKIKTVQDAVDAIVEKKAADALKNDPFFHDKRNKGLTQILKWLLEHKRRCEQQAYSTVDPRDPIMPEKIIVDEANDFLLV